MGATLDSNFPCGECGGEYMRGHFLHELMFRHTPDCEKRRYMDALAVADWDRIYARNFMRDIKPVERYLFECLGEPVIEDATVILGPLGGQVKRQYLRSNWEKLARSEQAQNWISPATVPHDTEYF